jgi:Peptidyl-tRNA hydrolase PTH2
MKKLYVIVRKDLSTSQQAVQAGHAVAAYLLHGQFFRRWENEILIYLGVKNGFRLHHLMEKMRDEGIDFVQFQEPDLNNETTAIATDQFSQTFYKLNLL